MWDFEDNFFCFFSVIQTFHSHTQSNGVTGNAIMKNQFGMLWYYVLQYLHWIKTSNLIRQLQIAFYTENVAFFSWFLDLIIPFKCDNLLDKWFFQWNHQFLSLNLFVFLILIVWHIILFVNWFSFCVTQFYIRKTSKTKLYWNSILVV